jgi:multiple antibiotic resistance protein
MKVYLGYVLFSLTSLFTIVNPLGAMPYFSGLTSESNRDEVKAVAQRATLAAFSSMITFGLTGEFIFKFFNVSVDGLRVVGGILFFITGYDMLLGQESRVKSIGATEISSLQDVKVKAITPLAIPLICGPGTITVMTVMMEEAKFIWQRGVVIFSAGVVCLATYFVLVWAKRIMDQLGESGQKVFSKLMGLILMMIAVEFFFRGITPYIHKLLQV